MLNRQFSREFDSNFAPTKLILRDLLAENLVYPGKVRIALKM